MAGCKQTGAGCFQACNAGCKQADAGCKQAGCKQAGRQQAGRKQAGNQQAGNKQTKLKKYQTKLVPKFQSNSWPEIPSFEQTFVRCKLCLECLERRSLRC